MSTVQWMRADRLLSLPSSIGIGEATELHRLATAALTEGPSVRVDASQVEEIDTAALQLLAALWRTSAAQGGQCEWLGPVPTAVRRASRLIGLHTMLAFPTDEKG